MISVIDIVCIHITDSTYVMKVCIQGTHKVYMIYMICTTYNMI